MESSQFSNKRAEIKERIRSLETERNTLENEIAVLRERVDIVELERYSTSLDNEIGTLKIEKALLEEKLAASSVFGPAIESINRAEEDPSAMVVPTTKMAPSEVSTN